MTPGENRTILRQPLLEFQRLFGGCPRQECGIFQLLPRKRQPGFNLRIELVLCFQIDRNVEQRAGWRNLDALGTQAPSGHADRPQSPIQI